MEIWREEKTTDGVRQWPNGARELGKDHAHAAGTILKKSQGYNGKITLEIKKHESY